MLPIIFSVGPIAIYTFGFLLAVGVFLESFIVWRRLRDLGLKEEKVLDFIIASLVLGFILSRLLFVLENFNQFGFHLLRWFFFIRYPGFSFWGWVLGVIICVWRFTKSQKWDFWRVTDEVTFGVLPFLVLFQIASFLDGSGFGHSTNMPWGIYFPGILLKRHPLSLFSAILLFLIWLLLIKIERHWRIWDWYKNKQGGFITLVGLGLVLLTNLPLAFLKDVGVYFYWSYIGLNFVGIILAAAFFWIYSGRSLAKVFTRKKFYETKNPPTKQAKAS